MLFLFAFQNEQPQKKIKNTNQKHLKNTKNIYLTKKNQIKTTEIIAKQNAGANEHGIYHRRGLTMPTVIPIPDLRSELDQPSSSPTTRPQFQGHYNIQKRKFVV